MNLPCREATLDGSFGRPGNSRRVRSLPNPLAQCGHMNFIPVRFTVCARSPRGLCRPRPKRQTSGPFNIFQRARSTEPSEISAWKTARHGRDRRQLTASNIDRPALRIYAGNRAELFIETLSKSPVQHNTTKRASHTSGINKERPPSPFRVGGGGGKRERERERVGVGVTNALQLDQNVNPIYRVEGRRTNDCGLLRVFVSSAAADVS